MPAPEDTAPIEGSIAWLVDTHLDAMEKMVESGLRSKRTLNKRRYLLSQLKSSYGEYSLRMPQSQVVRIQDDLADTPAWADSMVEAIRVMYRWAQKRGHVRDNPAFGVEKIDPGRGGASPWTIDDLRAYLDAHKLGTTPHTALTLLAFSGCRIGDARWLGRSNEITVDGIQYLGWQPEKAGSAYVEIPLMPQLRKATRALTVQGKTYLTNQRGQPFKSADVMSNTFIRWCRTAGLENRSAHGVRKALGHLLAEHGCSQYQIMAIHGHTQARTSETYTRDVERRRLARDAMLAISHIKW